MQLSLSNPLRFRPSDLSPATQQPQTPTNPKPIFYKPRTSLTVTAMATRKKKNNNKPQAIEGLSDELSSIAAQNLDFAPSRRRVRSAFVELQHGLDHYLFKSAPTGINTEEWYERNSKGLEIFCKSWIPEQSTPIKGSLFFCHGYGDTCTFFFEGIAKRIAYAGYIVNALDHPGFGLSEGLHGYIPSFDELADNVIEIYTKIKGQPRLKNLPHFILGQSMGGAVTLKVHLKEPREWDGIILVAPMCKIAEDIKPPPAVLKVLTIMSNLIPKAKLFPMKDLAALAFRDPIKREMASYNVIAYKDQMRLRTAVELLKATTEIEKRLDEVSAPLLILHGAADKVTDPIVSQFLYEKASSTDKILKLYEDGFHSVLEGEPDERIFTVLNDIIDWLDARSVVSLSRSRK